MAFQETELGVTGLGGGGVLLHILHEPMRKENHILQFVLDRP